MSFLPTPLGKCWLNEEANNIPRNLLYETYSSMSAVSGMFVIVYHGCNLGQELDLYLDK